jgi:putative ABC transport system permease protein
MRIVSGRDFTNADTDGSEAAVIVNRAFARGYLGDSPIGARLPMGIGYQDDGAEATVVGVVEDVRYLTASDTSQPEMYYSYRQLGGRLPVPVVTVLLRATGDPQALVPALRAAVREADNGLVPEALMTLSDRMLTALARPRLYAIVLGGFAAFALVVATVGLFGVLSYSVAQRSRELAVRAVLGARPVDIVGLVLRQAMMVTGAGLVAGLLGSAAMSRSIGALLYGVTPYDRFTFFAVPAILVIVAAAACFVPAHRAAHLDPLRALRS